MAGKDPGSSTDCDCCNGVDTVTPQRMDNLPGLSQVAYRMGRHGDFVESMRARLSGADYPALAALTTREASDFTLAIGDALACSLDVLGFYTERYAQEHYLRTATERLSVLEMARLIGYRPGPGVAASTHLAFTLQATPGAPAEPIVIPVGTRVQSVPGQDEQAQSFETTQATPASAAWNAIPIQQQAPRMPAFGDTQLWLTGIDNRLSVGDLLLIVGIEHENDPANERWDVRVIRAVQTHADRQLTEVHWQSGLGHTRPFVLPAGQGVRVYTLRARGAAFGSSAPDWRSLSDSMKADIIGLANADALQRPADTEEWPDFSVLAPLYPERRSGSAALQESVLAASIDDIVAAATAAAQGAATMAMHQATTAGAGVVLAGDAHLSITGTAAALDPAGAMASVAGSATRMQDRARTATVAALGAAAAADTAALVVAGVTLARQLPAALAPDNAQAMASVARHFAAVGVARAAGSPISAPAPGSMLEQIAARLPQALQPAIAPAEQLLSLADAAGDLLQAPRLGAQAAYQHIVAEVDRAIAGSIVLRSGRRAPLVRSPDTIDLFPANDHVVAGAWALLSVPGSVELYRITTASTASRAQYLLSGQTTRIQLSGELPDARLPAAFAHAVRTLSVHVQSEELTLAHAPLVMPVYGERLALDVHVQGLVAGQALALCGKRQRIEVARGAGAVIWTTEDGVTRTLADGDVLQLIDAPVRLAGNTPHYLDPQAFADTIGKRSARLRLQLQDRDGLIGQVTVRGDAIALAATREDDPVLSEIVFLTTGDNAVSHTRDRTVLTLASATRHCYDRRSARINANVAPATHGESIAAILGSGDARVPNAQFDLAQAPLTYVSAGTPSGRASTLTLRINDVAWHEVPSLYATPPGARVFETRQDDAGRTTIVFGDGDEGARVPSGTTNLRVRYRKGLGTAGNLAAGAITTLLSRPLGVTGAHNPQPATGGEDAETLARARDNAPLTVLTLDRAVSIDDYAHYARAFAGIDKAHALWIPAGPARGVFLTIAGVDGAALPEGGATSTHLRESLARHGDPLVPLRLRNYIDARFHCRLSVKLLADADTDAVLRDMRDTLHSHFSFAHRAFGQTVSVDEVSAVAHGVPGVQAVQVTRLHRSGQPPAVEPRLFARLPVASLTELPAPAELLTLADAPIELELMP